MCDPSRKRGQALSKDTDIWLNVNNNKSKNKKKKVVLHTMSVIVCPQKWLLLVTFVNCSIFGDPWMN